MDDETETKPWPKGGIILKNVKHDGYNLAKDIRITRIWLFGDDNGKEVAEDFKLIWKDSKRNTPDADFELLDFRLKSDTKNINIASPVINSDRVFAKYTPVGFIYAKYKLIQKKESFFFSKESDAPFFFEQKVLLTDYGRNPAHEPGAILDATRLFPLTSFNTNNPKIKRVRVDYRLHNSLDVFIKVEEQRPIIYNSPATSVFRKKPIQYSMPWTLDIALFSILGRQATVDEKQSLTSRPNQVGVFRDDEHLPGPVALQEELRGDLLDDLFYAGEKPMPWEICSLGLIDGKPGSNFLQSTSFEGEDSISFKKLTWDNIHWWGGFNWEGKGKQLPSTPGAFHAMHLHWRWGRVSGFPSSFDFLQMDGTRLIKGLGRGAFGSDQFKGYQRINNSTFDIGGPLIDPKIPNQTLRFALTKLLSNPSDTPLPISWDASTFPSQQKFEELFSTKIKPRSISQGDNLVLFFSFEARNSNLVETADRQFGGTFFIHGLYFGHNLEPIEGDAGRVSKGTIGKFLWQYGGGEKQFIMAKDVPQKWKRNADGEFE
jgi:hypothetical protein